MKLPTISQWNIYLFFLLVFTSCQKNTSIPVVKPSYSFFVAGHAYGSPVNAPSNYGLHPPFIEKIGWLNEQEHLKFGVFTGDVVRLADTLAWTTVFEELADLTVPFHVAPGNHDVNNRTLFEAYFPESYYAFQQEEDLFIILDPNLDGWNISGDQLDFLQTTLTDAADYRHIFVFFHQLIWWTSTAPWNNCTPNSFQNKADSLNFHTTILPLFKDLDNQVLLFAGDVGAVPNSAAICYQKEEHISFIASGMGVQEEDNFLVVEVDETGAITYQLIGLKCQNSISCLGNLMDY